MKPTIYYLGAYNGNGKSQVIHGLIQKIKQAKTDKHISYYRANKLNDLLCTIDIKNTRIGFLSHENLTEAPGDLLRTLTELKCDIILCTSVNFQELNMAVASLVSKGTVQSVFLKSIWSSAIEVDQLLEYEVNKLYEIIKIRLDRSSSFHENVTTTNQTAVG